MLSLAKGCVYESIPGLLSDMLVPMYRFGRKRATYIEFQSNGLELDFTLWEDQQRDRLGSWPHMVALRRCT